MPYARQAARCARLTCTPPESAQSAVGDRSSSAAWRCVDAVPTAPGERSTAAPAHHGLGYRELRTGSPTFARPGASPAQCLGYTPPPACRKSQTAKTAENQKREDPLMNISLGSLLLARQLARHSEPGTLYSAASMMLKGVWRNGSASDSRSEGWEFESLCPHFLPMLAQLWTEANELHGEHQ